MTHYLPEHDVQAVDSCGNMLRGIISCPLSNVPWLPGRGCLDALLVDSMVTQEAMKSKSDLSVAWIDYSKAFDRVPHQWLIKMLKTIRALKPLRQTLANLLPLWKSEFCLGRGRTAVKVDIDYQCGLFQGDSLSPLLFCLSIASLSSAMRGTSGYECPTTGIRITYTLFMDDLKVYSSGKRALERALSIVDRVSGVVGMELGLKQCAVAHILKGQVQEGGDIVMPNDDTIPSAGDGNLYRYLGIEQVFKPVLKTIRKSLEKK